MAFAAIPRFCYRRTMEREGAADLDAAIRTLVDENRTRCLWFLRLDGYPATLEERLRALDAVERHGDVDAFRRARDLRQ
jgi:hypothetical protein